MNGFVISVGSYVPELNAEAKNVAAHIGKVHVDVGNSACKVPLAKEYIEKVESKSGLGLSGSLVYAKKLLRRQAWEYPCLKNLNNNTSAEGNIAVCIGIAGLVPGYKRFCCSLLSGQ